MDLTDRQKFWLTIMIFFLGLIAMGLSALSATQVPNTGENASVFEVWCMLFTLVAGLGGLVLVIGSIGQITELFDDNKNSEEEEDDELSY